MIVYKFVINLVCSSPCYEVYDNYTDVYACFRTSKYVKTDGKYSMLTVETINLILRVRNSLTMSLSSPSNIVRNKLLEIIYTGKKIKV